MTDTSTSTGPVRAGDVRSTPVVTRRRRMPSPRTALTLVVVNGVLLILSFLAIFPLYWALSTSFLPADEINGGAQRLFVSQPTLENYRELFMRTRFLGAVGNSAFVSGFVTVGGTLFASMAGYAFAKLRFRGRDALFLVVLLTLMIPPLVTVPINFVLMSELRLLDTLWAVILPQLTPAFGIFWMRQYTLATLPDQLLEAARIDGCGEIRMFFRVVLPVQRPAVAGLSIFMFMASWNQLLLPLTYIQSNAKQTYPVFLTTLTSSFAEPQTNLAVAASVVSTLPLLFVFLFAQRQFLAGITAGAVKQ